MADKNLNLPAIYVRDQKTVRKSFWVKLAKVAGKIPFAEDAAAAWYCAKDPKTPLRVKATLMAALAYFVVPTDVLPDWFAGLGYTDDAAVIAAAIGLAGRAIKPIHRQAAKALLDRLADQD